VKVRRERDAYQAWLVGEVLLFALLASWLALFLVDSPLRASYELPHLRLVVETVVALAAGLVSLLAGARFTSEGRRSDLLICLGFFVASASTIAFALLPSVTEQGLSRAEAWAEVGARLFAWTLVAAAPFARGIVASHRRALRNWLTFLVVALAALWMLLHSLGTAVPPLVPRGSDSPPFALTFAYSAESLLSLVAAVGFGLSFRKRRDDLDRWLALGSTLMLFSSLHLVFTPLLGRVAVAPGDFLRLLGYGVYCVGVWRAIANAEFGRAVADERARLAREIHDGLAQYLFAISTHAAMLDQGGPADELVPRIRTAAAAAQQEARFAILALSSASGSAPFDAALTRYVEVLSADGALDVELEIDPRMRLDPDEQIEIFRIVQEGLANVRRHARARTATVRIAPRGGGRFVTIADDGEGFDGVEVESGQGLRNIRARSDSIGGALRLRTAPGAGTALEVALRA
jgi:signal transduction histidine kinase